ncbi:TetR/AcrR family transcriptional regulator [Leucobacter luti]|uniref:TetR family transcriptional regulator n=1 Tax=Leucobacter luti TaxID=340320 RepID=A0A4R6RSQ5_9MICO|nr:TetR/AcrR family transcriptional regulator [Leucobacter luti]MCW2289889.1 AcrR family transcriptional regulator [Leucobacter luti]QYM76969.1 TetR/AcrR family transcriptional regulator [Leucobacter luti]TCK36059.1 TetR family transcriptional regulator [Leucobacter luti]TDP89842.1 TetR family transcriptional regulator [Leucobacter luti]
MARPSTQKQRRIEVVDAALAAAAAHGLRNLSLTDVANQAGVTRGALLYYYDDLDAILVEAHAAGMARVGTERAAIVARHDTPADKLAAAISAGLPSGPDDALMRLLYEFDVLAGKSPLHDELVQRLYQEQLDLYTGILTEGVASGDFALTGPLADTAMNLVALEDAYGLHIVAGGSITVADAHRAIALYAAQAGARLPE